MCNGLKPFEQLWKRTTGIISVKFGQNPISGLGGDAIWRNCLRTDAQWTKRDHKSSPCQCVTGVLKKNVSRVMPDSDPEVRIFQYTSNISNTHNRFLFSHTFQFPVFVDIFLWFRMQHSLQFTMMLKSTILKVDVICHPVIISALKQSYTMSYTTKILFDQTCHPTRMCICAPLISKYFLGIQAKKKKGYFKKLSTGIYIYIQQIKVLKKMIFPIYSKTSMTRTAVLITVADSNSLLSKQENLLITQENK